MGIRRGLGVAGRGVEQRRGNGNWVSRECGEGLGNRENETRNWESWCEDMA